MGIPGGLAARLADELGMAVDDVKASFEGVNEATATQIGVGVLADQPQRVAGQFASGASTSAKFVGGGLGLGGLGIGGGLAAEDFFQMRETKVRQLDRQQQRELASKVLTNPQLSSDEKSDVIDDLSRKGLFSSLTTSGDTGDGPFPSLFSMKGILLIVVVFFVGKALVRASGNIGTSGTIGGGGA